MESGDTQELNQSIFDCTMFKDKKFCERYIGGQL
jgi:hypothetical protein